MYKGNMDLKVINPRDLLIYLCLRRYKNKITGEASVPISRLVKQTGAAPVTVLSSLEKLSESGYITYTKKGRANVYSFPVGIDVKSYDFLDKDISYKEKMDIAVQEAFSAKQDKLQGSGNDKLHSYICKLEEQIIGLSKQTRVLTEALNQARSTLSLLTGIPYDSIPQIEKPENT